MKTQDSNKIETRMIKQDVSKVEFREDGEEKTITGLGSVFYNGSPETEFELWDNVVERIDPHAFDNAIGRDDVRGLFNHNPDNILGRNRAGTMELSIEERGLKYDITPPDTQTGRDVVTSLKRKDVTGSSFSFMPTRVEWFEEGEKEVRMIKDVELFDVGPVTFPAYNGAYASARDLDNAKEELLKIKTERDLSTKPGEGGSLVPGNTPPENQDPPPVEPPVENQDPPPAEPPVENQDPPPAEPPPDEADRAKADQDYANSTISLLDK